MTIHKSTDGDTLVIALEGRLDTTTAPDLQNQLIPEIERVKHIRMDFRQLEYISSAGLRVLLLGEKTAKAGGTKLTVVNVSAEIQEIFEITGFSDFLIIE